MPNFQPCRVVSLMIYEMDFIAMIPIKLWGCMSSLKHNLSRCVKESIYLYEIVMVIPRFLRSYFGPGLRGLGWETDEECLDCLVSPHMMKYCKEVFNKEFLGESGNKDGEYCMTWTAWGTDAAGNFMGVLLIQDLRAYNGTTSTKSIMELVRKSAQAVLEKVKEDASPLLDRQRTRLWKYSDKIDVKCAAMPSWSIRERFEKLVLRGEGEEEVSNIWVVRLGRVFCIFTFVDLFIQKYQPYQLPNEDKRVTGQSQVERCLSAFVAELVQGFVWSWVIVFFFSGETTEGINFLNWVPFVLDARWSKRAFRCCFPILGFLLLFPWEQMMEYKNSNRLTYPYDLCLDSANNLFQITLDKQKYKDRTVIHFFGVIYMFAGMVCNFIASNCCASNCCKATTDRSQEVNVNDSLSTDRSQKVNVNDSLSGLYLLRELKYEDTLEFWVVQYNQPHLRDMASRVLEKFKLEKNIRSRIRRVPGASLG